VFGTTVGPDGLGPPNNLTFCPFNKADRQLSDTIMGYWASLAKHGNPNKGCAVGRAGAKCPAWPAYTPTTAKGAVSQLLVDGLQGADGKDLGPVVGMHADDCAFWAKHL